MPTSNSSTVCFRASIGASTGTLLARLRPLRRHATASTSTTSANCRAYRQWVVAGVQPQHAVRPVHDPPTRRGPRDAETPSLPRETQLDNQIASGFNRCNITTSEGGAIDEEYRVIYCRDRTETTSAVLDWG
jgi:hypothetical protein